MSLRGWKAKARLRGTLSGHVIPIILHPSVRGIVLAGWLLGLGVSTVGQPIGHPSDRVGDPVNHFTHIHGDLHRSSTQAVPL